MSLHAKTVHLIEIAAEILSVLNPMTVRQVYYQLVSRLDIKNNRSQYQAASNALVGARKDGTIPWEWIEDRTRQPRHVAMWNGLADFSETIREAYRRNVWLDQSAHIEVWLEKDALSGIFEDVLDPYGVTLNVGRGYDGWASIHNAAVRYGNGKDVSVLYFGDFDPSGEDMVRSLCERLAFLGCKPEIVKCALVPEDITRYNLPPDFTKSTDTRSESFVAKYGDVAVELDALPADVLRQRLIDEVVARMDMKALARTMRKEKRENKRLARLAALLVGVGR